MTTLLDRLPVDRISREARELHVGRTLLVLIAGLFFVAGWVVAKVFLVVWAALTWAFVAVRLGWQDARRTR